MVVLDLVIQPESMLLNPCNLLCCLLVELVARLQVLELLLVLSKLVQLDASALSAPHLILPVSNRYRSINLWKLMYRSNR